MRPPIQRKNLHSSTNSPRALQGDMAIVVDDTYVNYYIAAKNYDKAFEYGEKLFAIDPDNFANAVNMVRAAQEKGDSDKLFSYGAKAADILKRYKAAPAPKGRAPQDWGEEKARNLENAHDNTSMCSNSIFNGAYQTTRSDEARRDARAVRADVPGLAVRGSGNGCRGRFVPADAEHSQDGRGRQRIACERSEQRRHASLARGLLQRERRATR